MVAATQQHHINEKEAYEHGTIPQECPNITTCPKDGWLACLFCEYVISIWIQNNTYVITGSAQCKKRIQGNARRYTITIVAPKQLQLSCICGSSIMACREKLVLMAVWSSNHQSGFSTMFKVTCSPLIAWCIISSVGLRLMTRCVHISWCRCCCWLIIAN